MHEAGHPKLVLRDNLEGQGGEERRRGVQDGGDTYTYADSSWSMAKTTTILLLSSNINKQINF